MYRVHVDWISVVGNVAEKDITITTLRNHLKGSRWTFKELNGNKYFELSRDDDEHTHIASVFMNEFQGGSVRLDTSCHFINDEEFEQTLKPLEIMKNSHFSRIDVNIDLVNEHIDNMGLIFARFNSKQNTYQVHSIKSKTGNEETRYYGARRSNKMLRYYDKKVEREFRRGEVEFVSDKGNLIKDIDMWNRIELTVRGSSCSEYVDLFREVLSQVRVENLSKLDDAKQIAILHSLIDGTIKFKDLAKATATKYRNMIKDAQGFDKTLSYKLLSYFNNHINEVTSVVDKFRSKFH